MIINENDYLAHYGTLRKSGRYPWGSGEDQVTSNKMFLDSVKDMRRQGLNDVEISRGLGMSTTDLRNYQMIANNELKQAKIAMIQRLADKGNSNVAIGNRLGIPESTVRSLRAAGDRENSNILQSTASMLKEQVGVNKYLDVGSGTENYMNVTKTKLNTALTMLRGEGYEVHPVKFQQQGTGFETQTKVLTLPGVTQKEVWMNLDRIKTATKFSDDNGRTRLGILPPISIHPDRLSIKYGNEGGGDADGVIYVRPGIEDVSLGGSRYAQVRVQIGNDHYIKGIAMYKDDLPKGTDLMFNTSKDNTGNKLDALKPLNDDPDNPFGSTFKRQLFKIDDQGRQVVTSSMNIVYEEGDWLKWQRTIASQVLSKQSPKLAREQLAMALERRQTEFDAIKSLTNPTVKKKLLKEFSDGADSASVQLKAAGLPRQYWHAILPVATLSPTEVYAPGYLNGERVALIRYPHGGTFEIPELTVNNNHAESKRLLGSDPKDAIGIHPSVAVRLSGADFDGDTVLVIPNNSGKIKSTPALEGLKNFNPRTAYPEYPGMKSMSNTQTEMGKISNLITDMTIKGASTTDVARAIRHSMVVIDAEKHNLNYKQSYIDNGIKQLKEKYLTQPDGSTGASTLISRAKSQVYVLDRKERTAKKGGPIDTGTGQKVYEPTGKVNYKTGQPKMQRSTKLAETSDALTLSSGTPMERLYADHSNKLKTMANQARLEMIKTPRLTYSESANKTYEKEVKSLTAKLSLAISNRPLERQAQIISGSVIKAKRNDNPNMDAETLRKIKFQALEMARTRTGAAKQKIKIEPSEWDAIQAGAISDSKLTSILDNSDMDVVRKLATPREEVLMTSTKTSRARVMLASGYTRAEVASALGVSRSTLDNATSNA